MLLYARAVTPRRAVPLGLLALEELHRRRPGVELMLFGDTTPVAAPFPHRHLGVLDREALAHAYNSATVGIVLSTTNPSLVPTEMLACGLPVVDLASDAMLDTFGADGPIALAAFDPLAIADATRAAARRPGAARRAHAHGPRSGGDEDLGPRCGTGRGGSARGAGLHNDDGAPVGAPSRHFAVVATAS